MRSTRYSCMEMTIDIFLFFVFFSTGKSFFHQTTAKESPKYTIDWTNNLFDSHCTHNWITHSQPTVDCSSCLMLLGQYRNSLIFCNLFFLFYISLSRCHKLHRYNAHRIYSNINWLTSPTQTILLVHIK